MLPELSALDALSDELKLDTFFTTKCTKMVLEGWRKLWSAVASGIPCDTAFGAAKKSGVAPGPAAAGPRLATALQDVSDET